MCIFVARDKIKSSNRWESRHVSHADHAVTFKGRYALSRLYNASSIFKPEKYSKLLKIPVELEGELLSAFIALIFSRVTSERTNTTPPVL